MINHEEAYFKTIVWYTYIILPVIEMKTNLHTNELDILAYFYINNKFCQNTCYPRTQIIFNVFKDILILNHQY